MNYPKFLVNVTCLTFNHSNYIIDTMNGFCMQETNFPFICCILDDASTDGEQSIIKKYIEDNFDLSETSEYYYKETDIFFFTYARHKTNCNCYFAVWFLKENHYSNPDKYAGKKMEYLKPFRQKCKYESLCEGDDYWIDPNKLKKQADILNSDIEIGVVYTKSKIYNQAKHRFARKDGGSPFISFKSQMLHEPIMTLTTMSRIDLILQYVNEIQPDQKQWLMGDTPMWMWFAKHSKIYFLDEVTSVYRILENSASHSTDFEKQKKFNQSLLNIRLFFWEKYCPNDYELKLQLEDDYYRRNMYQALVVGHYHLCLSFMRKIKTKKTNDFVVLLKYFIKKLLKY